MGRWAVVFVVQSSSSKIGGKDTWKDNTNVEEAPGGDWHLVKCLSLKTDKLINDGIKTGTLQCNFGVGGRGRAAV